MAIGIVFYLGLPFLRDALDGQRLALRDRIAAAETTLAQLDERRDKLVPRLSDALRRAAVSLAGDWSGSVVFRDIAPAGEDALLVAGSSGTLVRISDHFSDAIATAVIESDSALQARIDALPERLRQAEGVAKVQGDLTRIVGERSTVEVFRKEAEQKLKSFWYGLLRLNKQREDFASFMAICRGAHPDATDVQVPTDGLESDPGGVTTACVNAWQAQVQAEAGNWWKTLAAQVPPGILLLFLLATLGGLYRYNLRLAGFHASRADLLEILAMRMWTGGGKLSKEEMEGVTLLADALAADKVPFGKANTPADQAAEIAKAALSRK